MRLREIVKRGGSVYIKLRPSDLHDLDLHIGDWIDVEDAITNRSQPEILNPETKTKRSKKKNAN